MFKIIKLNLIYLIVFVGFIFRIVNITSVPPSLFGDELDLGYHAYSILKTGKDYSGNFMPLHFQSLAEWRTPLYLYSAVPTVAVFGITPLGVRLPAVLFGTLSILGIYLLSKKMFGSNGLALLTATILAINPWSLQYSRAGFEVTMLISFLVFGLYFFLHSLENNGKQLSLSLTLLLLTPLIYSTAKLYTLFVLPILGLLYWRNILKIDRQVLTKAVLISLLVGGLTAYATLFSGGSQRFGYISVFSDPTIPPQIGVDRLIDAKYRGESGMGISPNILDRFFHNKVVYWVGRITSNYISAFSTNFLFVDGDPNPRHSIDQMGMFFKFEILFLIAGLFFLFSSTEVKIKTKILLALLLIFSPVAASITRDGGNHATRLILMLPFLTIIISYGIYGLYNLINKKYKNVFTFILVAIYLTFLIFYLHAYHVHYPYQSERWWHAKWGNVIKDMMEIQGQYDRVIISMADEPSWIFFAAHSAYEPSLWHQGFPVKGDYLDGFGGVSFIDKYYFGAIDEDGNTIYDLPKFISDKDLYLAAAKEIPWNLNVEPSRVPIGLKLIKAYAFESGDPAFYLFTKQ